MTVFEQIRKIISRHALERKLYAEMSALTDAEMLDFDLSPAKIAELSRQQACAA